jgi:hypothetical protein
MSPTTVAALIGGLAGLCTGILGSLVAPWVQWNIEKRRKDIEYKQKIISEVRKLLDEKPDIDDIKSSSYWGFIFEHLDDREKSNMSNSTIVVELNEGTDSDTAKKRIISRMLHRLEQKWGLINA